jgi:hypothetical protein
LVANRLKQITKPYSVNNQGFRASSTNARAAVPLALLDGNLPVQSDHICALSLLPFNQLALRCRA